MRFVLSASLCLSALLVSAPLGAPAAPALEIDHVILAINRLGQGIEEFTRLTGVVPERGGQHPGRGTENALVSLGEGRYLELLAPIASPDSGVASAVPFRQLTPAGWALHASDLGAIAASLRSAGFTVAGPTPGSRRRPDGALLQWQTAGVTGIGLELAPFLIQWDPSSPHPSTTAPPGCRLESLELTVPEPANLQRFFDTVGYGGSVRSGAREARLSLSCPKGRVSFTTHP